MKIKLKSGFQRGMELVALAGTFPNFTRDHIDRAGECTWVGDEDDTHEVEVDDADPRPIFLKRFWRLGSNAAPINAAARALCEQPLPNGWEVIIKGIDLGGAMTRDKRQIDGTLEGYVCDVAANRDPVAVNTKQHHILIRVPGNVVHSFKGSIEEALQEIDRHDAFDESGHTELHASYASEEEATEEFYRLTD